MSQLGVAGQRQQPHQTTRLKTRDTPQRNTPTQVHPKATKPAREGSDVGWTSGIVGPDAEEAAEEEAGQAPADKKVRKFHVVTTAQGAAVHWQVRVHYYW